MSSTVVVFRKELIDGLRDRRSVLSALIFPMLFPALITFMFNLIVERDQEADELDIPVVGAEHAPDLVDWFERRGYDVVEGPDDPQAAVRDKTHDVVVVITDDFVEDFNAGRTADVELVFDGSRKEASQAVGRVRGLIRGYDRAIGNLRLIARGISPRLGNPVSIDEVDLASARQRSASWFSFIPMIVILATFIGGMNVAIDATAGERERASLESLLVNPVSRRSLARGKWLAASVFSAASVGLSLAALLIALSRVPLQQLGIELHIGPREAAGLLLATLPLAFFAAGLQVLLATFARSYKEAQTYLSMLMFLPMVPHFIASMSSLGEAWWMLPIPALGQHVLLTDVLGGEALELHRILLVVLSPPLLGLACIEVTARLFGRERIIFGR
jgi:sodium transport system permease protein